MFLSHRRGDGHSDVRNTTMWLPAASTLLSLYGHILGLNRGINACQLIFIVIKENAQAIGKSYINENEAKQLVQYDIGRCSFDLACRLLNVVGRVVILKETALFCSTMSSQTSRFDVACSKLRQQAKLV